MTEKHRHNATLVARYERKIQHIKSAPKIRVLEQRNILGVVLRFLNPHEQCQVYRCNRLFNNVINSLLSMLYKRKTTMSHLISSTCEICHKIDTYIFTSPKFVGSLSCTVYDRNGTSKFGMKMCMSCIRERQCYNCNRIWCDGKFLERFVTAYQCTRIRCTLDAPGKCSML